MVVFFRVFFLLCDISDLDILETFRSAFGRFFGMRVVFTMGICVFITLSGVVIVVGLFWNLLLGRSFLDYFGVFISDVVGKIIGLFWGCLLEKLFLDFRGANVEWLFGEE